MHPADQPRYRIEAFRSQSTVDQGCDFDTSADTLKDAKHKARHCVSEDFARSGEMSAPFGYARVIDARDGSCAFDVCGKTGRKTPPADIRRAHRIAETLVTELDKQEGLERERCTGFDASDLLTDIRAARDQAAAVVETLSNRLP